MTEAQMNRRGQKLYLVQARYNFFSQREEYCLWRKRGAGPDRAEQEMRSLQGE